MTTTRATVAEYTRMSESVQGTLDQTKKLDNKADASSAKMASRFETLAKAEKSHAGRFQKALDELD